MKTLLKGFVADGINEPSRMAVLVENDRIIAVEKELYGSCVADKIYSFKDEIIAPGFTDVHGHSDISILACPGAESKRRQGVTCEITGNCGLSPFPLTGKNREHLEHLYANYGIPLTWENFTGYKQTLADKKVNLRTFSICGHNTLRAAVAAYDTKELSPEQKLEMAVLLEKNLAAGAKGLSTGLLYTPGCFADADEITDLMRILAKYNAVYATHLRSEGDRLLESLQETLDAARNSGLTKLQISHLKTAGKDNWHKLDEVLELINQYRNEGIDIRFDRYPYVESQTMLSVILPPPFDTMPDRDITIALQDEAARETVRNYLKSKPESDWSRWRLTGTNHPEWRKFIGKKYTEIPGNKVEAVIEQLTFDATTATIGAAGMSENNMLKIINHPLCMPGTDGNALPESTCFGTAHPRAFGAVAKFIRLKLDSGCSIGQAVKSVSSSPADFFNLENIGTLQTGKKADITVFSPDNIDSDADFIDPHRFARGITMTMLDGIAEFY